ncbi:MAG: CoA ester lyase [Dehalococcoidia bacterium]|nr:CoA ester lyase [Dehalococcoidia bacterium]
MPEARLRRSVHFVPGANEKMLTRSLELEADSLVLDLEDAVTPQRKDEARQVVAGWLRDVDFGRQERMVRMNPLDTPWGLEDLRATMVHPPDVYMVPKPRTLADLQAIDAELTRLEREHGHPAGGVGLLVVATETAHRHARTCATFTQCPRVTALSWGAEDLSADLGARRNRDDDGNYLDVFRYCRIQTLLCAAAGEVQPVDTVFVDINDTEGLRREARDAAWMGYTGKITIHPSQVPVVNEMFTPSEDELAEARELLDAFEAANAEGNMAFSFHGQMVDVPHLERARKIVERAQAAGLR